MTSQTAIAYLRGQGVSVRLEGADVLFIGAENVPTAEIARLRKLSHSSSLNSDKKPQGRCTGANAVIWG
jgi:hypothetical protein